MGTIDHLVYATPDVDASVEHLARRLGVRASPGGHHAGRGTRNALLGLGRACYLEIVGPDASRPSPDGPRWFGLDALDEARLVAWAARDADLEAHSALAAAAQFALGPVVSGSRRRPDGQLVAWRFTDPAVLAAEGVVPFLIDWGVSPHPAEGLSPGVRLVAFRAEHPASARLQPLLRELGLATRVLAAPRPRLVATLETPRGWLELS